MRVTATIVKHVGGADALAILKRAADIYRRFRRTLLLGKCLAQLGEVQLSLGTENAQRTLQEAALCLDDAQWPEEAVRIRGLA